MSIANLQNINNQIQTASDHALLATCEKLKQIAIEVTPKEFGNLRSSAYPWKIADNYFIVGYASNYAVAVHEAVGVKHYTTPNTGPKFLQKSIDNNKPELINLYYSNMIKSMKSIILKNKTTKL